MNKIGVLLMLSILTMGCQTSTWNLQREKLYQAHSQGLISGERYLKNRSISDEWEFYSLYRSLSPAGRRYIQPPYPVIKKSASSSQPYYVQTDAFSGIIKARK